MNRTTTIVLVVILAALALYVVVVQNPRDQAAATPTAATTTRVVWETTADQIVSLRVAEPAANRSTAMSKDAQGNWTVTQPTAGPADVNRLVTLTSNVATLSVSSVVTSVTDLTAYGVLSPTYTLEIGLADGQQLKASIGAQAPVGGGYFVLRDGDANVMVVAGFSIESLVELLNTPPYAPTATPAFSLDITPGTPDGTVAPEATPTP